MKMAESLATPRCFSSAPSICFNHMVTGKKNYPVHKASKIKKSVWVTKCVAGNSATEHRAPSLMRDLSCSLGFRAAVWPPPGGFRAAEVVGLGDRCGAVWQGWAWKIPEMFCGKEIICSLLFFFFFLNLF